jgi:alpha-aminoadipate carrier protein LysW
MNTQVRIKELSIDSNGDITVEGVEIDVTEKTLVDLVGFFLKQPKQEKEGLPLVTEKALIEVPANKEAEKTPTAAPAKKVEKKKENAVCPECASELKLDDQTMISEILQCTDCGVELEITCLDPLAVETAPEEEEDWGE